MASDPAAGVESPAILLPTVGPSSWAAAIDLAGSLSSGQPPSYSDGSPRTAQPSVRVGAGATVQILTLEAVGAGTAAAGKESEALGVASKPVGLELSDPPEAPFDCSSADVGGIES